MKKKQLFISVDELNLQIYIDKIIYSKDFRSALS